MAFFLIALSIGKLLFPKDVKDLLVALVRLEYSVERMAALELFLVDKELEAMVTPN